MSTVHLPPILRRQQPPTITPGIIAGIAIALGVVVISGIALIYLFCCGRLQRRSMKRRRAREAGVEAARDRARERARARARGQRGDCETDEDMELPAYEPRASWEREGGGLPAPLPPPYVPPEERWT